MADPAARTTRSIRGAIADPESDSADVGANNTRGIYVGTSGDVKVTLANGDTVTFKNLASGVIHPIEAEQIFSTGTTASDVIACF